MKRRDFLQRVITTTAAGAAVPSVLSGWPQPARAAAAPPPEPPERPLFEETTVYVSGEGYPSYRIPSLLATREGTLLAFAEGRAKHDDHAKNDIVLRRSTDRGQTWTERQVVEDDGPDSLNNPQVVQVSRTGRLVLMYQRYPEGCHSRCVVPGYEGEKVCRSYVTYSDDDGQTWSAPTEVTRGVKRPDEVTSVASGPGIGIELRHEPHAGRLVMPFNQGPWGKWKVYAAYSDDGGETWDYGETAPNGSAGVGNEVQMVELSDGALLLNARNQGGHRCRKTALSYDGGETWSPLVDDSVLIEPECQGTILRCSGGPGAEEERDRLLFANPASKEARRNGTVRISYDEGRTWPVERTVYEGEFAYSCLTRLADGTIGLLYERDGYETITFARFNLAWLNGGTGG
jgi:sialidase-1